MRELTAEQQRAVTRREGSLLLAAAAGAGKTSVLVERFVRAVCDDGISPGRILAITFTERAAGEMRERVRSRFVELGARDAVRETETAHIGTVHALCARLLRSHALAAGLDPDFSVLDEPRAARLRSRAFQRALGELLGGAHPASALDLVAAYGADRLQATIVAVHEALRSRGQRRPSLPALPDPGVLATAVRRTAAELGASATLAGVEVDAATGSAGAGARVLEALTALERAAQLVGLAGSELDAIAIAAAVPLPGSFTGLGLPAANGSLGGPACETYRRALAAYAGASADWHAREALVLVGELLGAYDAAYADLKQARASVDFDDLELGARDLLVGDAALRQSWSQRFALVMVDEFQDINPRQLAILAALEQDNLFTVGDEFQSIYGFRHADVGLFRARRDELKSTGASLRLSGNFRSRAGILDVVNAVFSAELGSGFTPLAAERAEHSEDAATHPQVDLLLTDARGWDDQVEVGEAIRGSLPPAPRWRHAEARLLAQEVADLVERGDARAGDVAVLMRAGGDIAIYERALQERGLPTLAAGAGGYWSHQQVGDLLAYLGALANPLDEQALYGSLASPLGGVSSNGLALLARAVRAGGGSAAQRAGAGGAWELLRRLAPPAGVDLGLAADHADDAFEHWLAPDDLHHMRVFAGRLERERRLAPRHSIAQLLERVIADTGYDRHVLALDSGERRLANVHKLLRLARAYEASEGRDLRGFLDHVASQGGGGSFAWRPPREAEAPIADADVDAVRLMTIHAAKGLEFGVVAVADLGRQGRVDTPDVLVDGNRVGLRLVALDGSASTPALDYPALRQERLDAEAHEEQRILYVAMTRARDRLLMSGARNVGRWPPRRPGAPPLSWLGPALAQDLCQELDADTPIRELSPPGAPHAKVRCLLNSPATLGSVLRQESIGPLAAGPGLGPPLEAADAPGRVAPAALVTDTPFTPAGQADAPGGGAERAAAQTLSYTTLAEFERCGYRYYLERVLGIAPEEGGSAVEAAAAPGGRPMQISQSSLDARARGSLVHRLLEGLDFSHVAPPAPDVVARAARELGASLPEGEARAVGELVAAVAGTELGARLAAAPRVLREHSFAFLLAPAQTLIIGAVDAIAYELGGRCLVVDYKSDRVEGEDLETLTERHYGVQRRIYGLAALRAGALEVDVAHWYLARPGAPVSVHYDASDADALADQLVARTRALQAGEFAVAPIPHRELCRTCPGRRDLCVYDEAQTMRPWAQTLADEQPHAQG